MGLNDKNVIFYSKKDQKNSFSRQEKYFSQLKIIFLIHLFWLFAEYCFGNVKKSIL
jgi:hypothetical protein